jgi:hypothetical protein
MTGRAQYSPGPASGARVGAEAMQFDGWQRLSAEHATRFGN